MKQYSPLFPAINEGGEKPFSSDVGGFHTEQRVSLRFSVLVNPGAQSEALRLTRQQVAEVMSVLEIIGNSS